MKNFAKTTFFLLLLFTTTTACGQRKAPEDSGNAVVNITQADFIKKVWDYKTNSKDWKYNGDLPCVIDFYASWCGPCKMLSPILEELAQEYKGKIVVYKVDTEKERQLAADFGINQLPTILFCPKDGQPQGVIGYKSKDELKKVIDGFLLKKP